MVNNVKNSQKIQYSFIVPIYNNEEFLNKCIKSIECQSIRCFEVIIVDDGSTDNSYTIAKKLKKNYHNISIFKQKNKGQTSARKLGLKHARGKYICLVDSDDGLDEKYLTKIDSYIKKYPDLDLLFFNGIEVHENYEKKLPYSTTKKREYYNKEMVRGELRKSLIFPKKNSTPVRGHAGGAVYKKDFLIKYIVKDNSIRVAEDGITLAMCVYYANSVCFINDDLYYYNCCNNKSIGNIYGKGNYPEYYTYLIAKFENIDFDIVKQLHTHYCGTLNAGFFRPEILKSRTLSSISKNFYNGSVPFYKIFWSITSTSVFQIKYKLQYILIKCRMLKVYLLFYKAYLKIREK